MNDLTSVLGVSVPIVALVIICICVVQNIKSQTTTRIAQQETLQRAIQAGQHLDEAALKALLQSNKSPEADLRHGIVSVCLAVGFGLAAGFSVIMMDERTLATIMGLAGILVGAVGVGQLVAWRVRSQLDAEKQTAAS